MGDILLFPPRGEKSSYSKTKTAISSDLAMEENQTFEKLEGSAQSLGRFCPPYLEKFEFSLETCKRWDEDRHAEEPPTWPSYTKIMVSFFVGTILVWQLFGLIASSACDYGGPPPGNPLQVPGVPQFVLDYAPLVWLHENESYFPSDMFAHVTNTKPKNENFEVISDAPDPLTLENLSDLNRFLGAANVTSTTNSSVFLTSNDDITTNPVFLNGTKPHPKTLVTHNATSCAIIVNDKGMGIVDAFYMYFYAFNQGNTVTIGVPPLIGFSREIGDHVGDWEHSMIRFIDGKPTALWYSQHEFGASYTYDAVIAGGEFQGIRPYVYSAIGSHANYAVAGSHDHTIPDVPGAARGLLNDYTSKGFLWDPTQSAHFYNWHSSNNSFESLPVSGTNDTMGQNMSPVGAMDFRGQWGDQRYPDDDPRQELTFGFAKYESGPTGPQDKQLERTDICPTGFQCIVRTQVGP